MKNSLKSFNDQNLILFPNSWEDSEYKKKSEFKIFKSLRMSCILKRDMKSDVTGDKNLQEINFKNLFNLELQVRLVLGMWI